MSISRLAFVPVMAGSGPKSTLRILVDGREYVTSCFLVDDLVNLSRRFAEIAAEGRRFDLFFSNASPFSVSVSCRGGALWLRLSDSFDGGVLEDSVSFISLKYALIELIEVTLRVPGPDMFQREELKRGLEGLKAWQGPVKGM